MKTRRRLAAVLATVALGLAGGLVSAQPASAATPGHCADIEIFQRMKVWLCEPIQWLDAGKSWYFGNARMIMQADGNLVIYDKRDQRRVLWASNTNGRGATQMRFQEDGNLVLYRANNSAVWATGTNNKCGRFRGPYLALQPDSNLVIYCHDHLRQPEAIWATGSLA